VKPNDAGVCKLELVQLKQHQEDCTGFEEMQSPKIHFSMAFHQRQEVQEAEARERRLPLSTIMWDHMGINCFWPENLP